MSSEERKVIERGLKFKLVVNGLWEPISTEWYVKWKTFIEAETDE
jgi:hypothetical protein